MLRAFDPRLLAKDTDPESLGTALALALSLLREPGWPQRTRAFAAEFGWNVVAGRYEALYSDLLEDAAS